ncbi:MAG: UDP-N-acetylmuramate dehydrogenase [Bacteroidales bacterium]|nr:UDP-N-acetylmuramate dehydrogenase [Bacteroidales bacterium]
MAIRQSGISLKEFNTFGMDVKARDFSRVSTLDDLWQVMDWIENEPGKLLFLGGGSNLLFTSDFDGWAVAIQNKGIEILSRNEDFVRVKVAAGENWHDFVMWCVENGFGGLENLSLIPGNVGSSPIQNIGAYGVELKDSFQSLEAYDLESREKLVLEFKDCRFGYRDSIFKQELKGRVILWSVTFRLSVQPVVQLSYGAISQELNAMGILNPGIKDVSEAVCRIRRSKLPDPAEIGNAGSFFKNPVVSAEKAEMLQASYPGIVTYPVPDFQVKLAAGWLIEQCRFKGFRRGDAGVHPNQALVLVNYGSATGSEILELAEEIQQAVLEKFDVLLEMEVNVV